MKKMMNKGLVSTVIGITLMFGLIGCAANVQEKSDPEVLYILFDASGQNYNCEPLRQSNYRVVQKHVSDYIKNANVKKVQVGVFSKYVKFISAKEASNRVSSILQKKRLKHEAKNMINKAYMSMDTMYSRLKNGYDTKYGSDVFGAIQTVINTIKHNGDKKAHIVIASTMIQGVDRNKVVKILKQRHIKLPEGTDLVAFHKAFVCSEGAEYNKMMKMKTTEISWQKVIEGSIKFDNAY